MNGKMSVIHRKAQFARQEFDARGMSVSKALRVALARVADRQYDLPLVVNTVEQVETNQANLSDHLANEGLLVLLSSAASRYGALCLDLEFLTALIEVQTMGMVRSAPAQARQVTRTDAAICAPFIDQFFEAVHAQLEEATPKIGFLAYRFEDMMEDARTVSLALDAPDYKVFNISVDLADGAKTGLLTVILPVEEPQRQKMPHGQNHGATSENHGLADVVRNAPVTLNAVLDRLEMPLKEVCKLQVGMRFPIAPTALSEAQLTATGGHNVARVVLGQVNGFRAVRLLAGRNGELLQETVKSAHVASDDSNQDAASTGAQSMAIGPALGSSPKGPSILEYEPDDDRLNSESTERG